MGKAAWIVFWLMMGAVAIAVATLFVACFGIATKGVDKDKVGDMATWSGAIFAGLAFAGTIWIATAQERRRRFELAVRAKILIPVVVSEVNNSTWWVEAVVSSFDRWSKDQKHEHWQGMIEASMGSMNKISFPDVNVLQELAFLDAKCATLIHMARGESLIAKHLVANLRAADEGDRIEQLEGTRRRLKVIKATSETASRRLKSLEARTNL